jgi:hypothetical protein
MVTLLAPPLGAFAIWALLVWPRSLSEALGGAVAALLALIVALVWRARAGLQTSQDPPRLPDLIGFAVLARLAFGRAASTAWMLAFGDRTGGYLRVRRPDARPGQAQLGWALNLLPGVQTISVDEAGLLTHVLDDARPPLQAIRDLDRQSQEPAP